MFHFNINFPSTFQSIYDQYNIRLISQNLIDDDDAKESLSQTSLYERRIDTVRQNCTAYTAYASCSSFRFYWSRMTLSLAHPENHIHIHQIDFEVMRPPVCQSLNEQQMCAKRIDLQSTIFHYVFSSITSGWLLVGLCCIFIDIQHHIVESEICYTLISSSSIESIYIPK